MHSVFKHISTLTSWSLTFLFTALLNTEDIRSGGVLFTNLTFYLLPCLMVHISLESALY